MTGKQVRHPSFTVWALVAQLRHRPASPESHSGSALTGKPAA